MKHTDFMALAGRLWGELSAEEKAPFERQAAEAKERHAKELAEWQKHGYYTLADGTKSNAGAKGGGLDGLSGEEEASNADEGSKPRRVAGKPRGEAKEKKTPASAKGAGPGSRPASKIVPRAPSRSPSKPASKGPSAANTPAHSQTEGAAGRASETESVIE